MVQMLAQCSSVFRESCPGKRMAQMLAQCCSVFRESCPGERMAQMLAQCCIGFISTGEQHEVLGEEPVHRH